MSIILTSKYYLYWKTYIPLSPRSIQQYTTELKKLEEYILQSGFTGCLNFDQFYFYKPTQEYSSIDEEFLRGFIRYLKEQKNASHGVLFSTIVALRNFFGFLKASGLIKVNPVSSFHNPYYQRKIYNRALSLKESEQLLQVALKADPFTRQYYVIVLLLLTTGLRNSELRSLTYDQIDFERNVIYVDKGQKTNANTVYMTDNLADEMARYLFHPHFVQWKEKNNSIIFHKNNAPYRNDTLNNLLKTLSKQAGIKKEVSAHCLRHTMAYLMQKEGVSIRVIQRQLRHKMLGTTLRYVSTVNTF
ncbi:site-specific integrase [Brevibacillus fluminis]|uniref:Site-specific integrase n=1 Tax=Brevibacillus fluminis TaxID=511487 RepID=A0A3M8DZT9_9BACL|nr:site-specific integrase [Brevibacillus fluminis]RNB92497.1 site-specific integrase [Brevibacillus fluminis]